MARRRDPAQYRTGWPVNVQLRVRRVAGLVQPSPSDVGAVLEAVASTGQVPAGWELAAVQWEGFRRAGREDFVSSGWRRGEVEDLRGLVAPMLAAGPLQLGWEKVTRRVVRKTVTSWARYRSAGTGRKPRGQWVSDAYAARYPHLVYVGKREERRQRYVEEVDDYEAELRVDYEP